MYVHVDSAYILLLERDMISDNAMVCMYMLIVHAVAYADNDRVWQDS